ncbi:MAG TPA: hypothetical protein VND24_09805 [Steroidobacteraceae bacterium]|nr:hypothetical protein [Steroidobacteraceae bacterium]
MRREIGFACLAAVALALGGCGVRLQDETPPRFQANPDLGMYPIKVKVTSGSMVSQPVYVFALSGGQRVPLSPATDGTYRTMLAVRCRSSFALQYLAVWRLQGMSTRQELFPAQPREVRLTAPPLTRQVTVDTSGKPDRKTRSWQGAVRYDIVTDANAHITGAQIEPVAQDNADVKAAKPIRIVSGLPLDASCGIPTAVQLASRSQRAHANLVIDTDIAGMPQWTTRVDFAPQ